jgi:hypothetical protein
MIKMERRVIGFAGRALVIVNVVVIILTWVYISSTILLCPTSPLQFFFIVISTSTVFLNGIVYPFPKGGEYLIYQPSNVME